ncbi:hypothetical protein PTKIN_Ptkin14bG0207800 [Pterospermum kingtungense]
MAESLISLVLEQLASITIKQAAQAFKLVSEVDEEVENLTRNLQAIQAVLEDAEERQVKDKAVKQWLDKLRDVSFDIDDVLDEWNTAILKREIEPPEEAAVTEVSLLKKVRSSILSSCFCVRQVVLRHETALKIEELNKKLAVIANERSRYNFKTERESREQRNITTSVIDDSGMFVREEDKNTIKDMLLCESSEETGALRIISVVGMGGIGKTTLSRLAFNDPEVESHFEKRIWVCVSDPFEEQKIAVEILESLGGRKPDLAGKDNIMREISKCAFRKKILLVLDDVWTEDSSNWEQLKGSLKNSSPESRILVTTRKEMVGKAIGSRSSDMFLLGKLSEDKCWSLFCHLAFFERTREECENLEGIGRKIVERCNGLPLAVKTLGGLLRFKTRDQWRSILDSKLWEIEEVENGVFPPLLLSYYDLPPALKQCFSYCAIFPKDCNIHKDQLIKLWIAQGFVKQRGNKGMEMIGEEYFNTLTMRSFFQDFETFSGEIYCKMHDIVHDFAQFLAGEEHLLIEFDDVRNAWKNPFLQTIRHSMLMFDREGATFPIPMDNWKKLRTLLINSTKFSDATFKENVVNSVVDHVMCLRALDLNDNPHTSHGKIRMLPDKIGKLIHLRNGEINTFAETKGVCGDTEMESPTCSLQGLGKLTHLQGDLTIKGLGKVADSIEAKEARLSALTGLSKLTLPCYSMQPKGKENEVFLLEALEPPPNLETLDISGLNGPTLFPNWMMSLTMLKSVTLSRCEKWESLPPMGKLPSLEYLAMYWMNDVKKVGEEFLGMERVDLGQTSSSVTKNNIAFPNLKRLEFYYLTNWEEWEYGKLGGGGDTCCITIIMPRLQYLKIVDSYKLKALPDHLLQNSVTIQELEINGCNILQKRFEKGSGEDWPCISHIPAIKINRINVKMDGH